MIFAGHPTQRIIIMEISLGEAIVILMAVLVLYLTVSWLLKRHYNSKDDLDTIMFESTVEMTEARDKLRHMLWGDDD